jgi:hypothetical protein
MTELERAEVACIDEEIARLEEDIAALRRVRHSLSNGLHDHD